MSTHPADLRRLSWPQFPHVEATINAIVDAVRRQRPISSATVKANVTEAGTSYQAIIPPRQVSALLPFEVYRTDALKVKVAAGRILLHGIIVEVAESSDITIPANSTAHRIWLSLASEFGTDATAIGGTINNGASGWSGYPAQPNTGAFRHWLLAEVVSGADSITDLGIKWTGDIPWPPPLGFWK